MLTFNLMVIIVILYYILAKIICIHFKKLDGMSIRVQFDRNPFSLISDTTSIFSYYSYCIFMLKLFLTREIKSRHIEIGKYVHSFMVRFLPKALYLKKVCFLY